MADRDVRSPRLRILLAFAFAVGGAAAPSASAHEGSGALCPLVIDDLRFQGDAALARPQQPPGSPVHTLDCTYGDVTMGFRWLEVAGAADIGCGRDVPAPDGAALYFDGVNHAEGWWVTTRPDLRGVVQEHARVISGLVSVAAAPCAAAAGSGVDGPDRILTWAIAGAGVAVLAVTAWRRSRRRAPG